MPSLILFLFIQHNTTARSACMHAPDTMRYARVVCIEAAPAIYETDELELNCGDADVAQLQGRGEQEGGRQH